jgi:hypothetical protein
MWVTLTSICFKAFWNRCDIQSLLHAGKFLFWEAQWNADMYNTKEQGQ